MRSFPKRGPSALDVDLMIVNISSGNCPVLSVSVIVPVWSLHGQHMRKGNIACELSEVKFIAC
jgi:hypothetical protein